MANSGQASSTSSAAKSDMQPNGKRQFRVSHGTPRPFGATVVKGGVNFCIGSSTADACTLVIFKRGEATPLVEIPIPEDYRFGNVYAIKVHDIDHREIEYGYRFFGPSDIEEGGRFDPTKILLDPYAKSISGREVWRAPPDWLRPGLYRGYVVHDDFDWGDSVPPKIPLSQSVIYEAHVRGMTASPSSNVDHPGTYDGLRQKIPYLKDLGVTAIELLPIFEFDEHDGATGDPDSPDYRLNYWGYNTVNYFAPKRGYSIDHNVFDGTTDLKRLIRDCHKAGIEVILDVVFNHTAEGDHRGNTFSFRGIDDKVYYMLTPEGWYYNFSGCGNVLNANHPVVRSKIIDCLIHWVTEYRIDGFRFDLASILDRDEFGAPMATPPLLASLTHLPIFAKTKLIAEAWDAGGLYQVGHFPSFGRFAEWNGKFRDTARKFLKGEAGQVGDLAMRLAGSPDLYLNSESHLGINFITCHDGFTLNDLVSYNEKHNEPNGHGNSDGADDNNSWNHGAEGETDDPEINALRMRQMKNAFVLLVSAVGVPMISMGDEIARTQMGNNNAYCHDNEITWMDWSRLKTHGELHRFVRRLLQFKHQQPAFQRAFPSYNDNVTSFHGTAAWRPDYSSESRYLGMMLDETHDIGDPDLDIVYVAFNTYWEALNVELPELPLGRSWRVLANTGVASPHDIYDAGQEPLIENQAEVLVGPRSTMILVGRRDDAQ